MNKTTEKTSFDNRAKLLLIARILYEQTEEGHGLSGEEIISCLSEYGIKEERKTLYKDIDCLRKLGHDIIAFRNGRNTLYHIGERHFELSELRLLIDAVLASHSITGKKTQELIRKLEYFAGKTDAESLNRDICISNQRKAENNTIYYSVNDLHLAIRDDEQITFRYLQWTTEKKAVPKYNNKTYEVSPWALIFDHEYYYLIGYDQQKQEMRHYRIDKMKNLTRVKKPRLGRADFMKYDMESFSQSTFNMFDGPLTGVTLRAKDSLVGVMIDRFGKDIPIHENGDGTFDFTVDIRLSDPFLGWLVGIGKGVEITKPAEVREKMRELLEGIGKMYR